jgi:hypothetical protein
VATDRSTKNKIKMLYISNPPRSYEQELISIFQPFKTFQKERLIPTPQPSKPRKTKVIVLGVHVCHVKTLNPKIPSAQGYYLKLGHTVSCFALCSSRFDGLLLLANFGSRSRFLLLEHFSYLNTEEPLAYFAVFQATTGNLEWRPRLGGSWNIQTQLQQAVF